MPNRRAADEREEPVRLIPPAIKKNRPYGSEKWVSRAVAKFGLESTLRDRGRVSKRDMQGSHHPRRHIPESHAEAGCARRGLDVRPQD